MIKNFGQWIVVKDGIETSVGYGYCWISKDDVTPYEPVHTHKTTNS